MVKKLFKYTFIASKYVVLDGRILDREHIYEIKNTDMKLNLPQDS